MAQTAPHKQSSNVSLIFSGSHQKNSAPAAVETSEQADQRLVESRPRRSAQKVDIDAVGFAREVETFLARRADDNRNAFADVTGPIVEARERAAMLGVAGREIENRIKEANELRRTTAAMLQAGTRKPRKPDYYTEDLGKEREMFQEMRPG